VSQLPESLSKPNHRLSTGCRIPARLVVLDRVQCRFERALVADPQRTGWSKGNAPSVHQVRVLQLCDFRNVGTRLICWWRVSCWPDRDHGK